MATVMAQYFNLPHPKAHDTHDVVLVYVDHRLEVDSEECRKVYDELQQRSKEVILFNDDERCSNFFDQLTSEQVIVILFGPIQHHLLRKMEQCTQVYSIYILGDEPSEHPPNGKVKGVFVDMESIYENLSRDMHQRSKNDISITYSRPEEESSNRNANAWNPSFIYTQLFKKVLLGMDDDRQSTMEFMSCCQMECAKNRCKPEDIADFIRNYRPEEAIRYYTQYPFIYEPLNRALRDLDGDTIIKMGPFIRNLHYQIQQLHHRQMSQRTAPFTLYRGQALSIPDFENLKKSKGQLMSFNCFLSTSETKSVSELFAHSNAQNEGKVGVLFEIQVDPKVRSAVFATIRERSQFQEEDEVLFSMHSVFRTGHIERLEGLERCYKVQLTMTMHDDQGLWQLIEQTAREIAQYPKDEQLRRILERTGDAHRLEKRYLDLLARSNSTSEMFDCYVRLGFINQNRGEYEKALEYNALALSIYDDRIIRDELSFAELLHSIATIHFLMGDYPKALEQLKKSAATHDKILSPINISSACCWSKMGIVYQSMGMSQDAFTYTQKALEIAEQLLTSNHPILGKFHLNMGALCGALECDPEEQSKHINKALKILEGNLPPNHPWLTEAHATLCAMHIRTNDSEKVLFHYQRAVAIYEQNPVCNPAYLGALYNNVAHYYLSKKDYPEALMCIQKAYDIFEKILPDHHPYFVAIYGHFCQIYGDIEEYSDAVHYGEKALSILEQTTPSDHQRLLALRCNLALLYYKSKDYINACSHWRKALNIAKRVEPENYQLLATLYIRLGTAYAAMEELALRTLYFQAALNIQRRHHLPVDPDIREVCRRDIGPVLQLIRLWILCLQEQRSRDLFHHEHIEPERQTESAIA